MNRAFEIDILFIDDNQGSATAIMELSFTDSDGDRGTISRQFANLLLGVNLFPFSTLPGQVNLESVDEIELTYSLAGNDLTADIDSFSAVSAIPEPSTGLLLGSSLLGLIGITRRKRAA